jgi:hypothetical protein
MRRLLTLVVLVAGALIAASSGSALTAGTTLSCSFSPEMGTPAWSDVTGIRVGTKTVCSRTTLTFDHNESQCRNGHMFSVPVYFGTASLDFYLGQAAPDGALRPNAAPVFSIGVFAGFVDDDANVTPLGTACGS